MMLFTTITLSSLGLASLTSAKFLASTTRYYDGQEGACGCGSSSGIFGWQLGISTGVYTAAASQALFDTAGGSWCGGGCGKCYNLTSTGDSACSTCGTGATKGTSIIVMVTNLCPHSGNEQWCANVGGTNEWGFSYHFDIMAESQVFGDNAVVEFEPVACPGQATTDWEQCICHGQTATDETPVGLGSSSSDAAAAAVSTSAASVPSSSAHILRPSALNDGSSSSSESTSSKEPVHTDNLTSSSSRSSSLSKSGGSVTTSTHAAASTTTPATKSQATETQGAGCPAHKVVYTTVYA